MSLRGAFRHCMKDHLFNEISWNSHLMRHGERKTHENLIVSHSNHHAIWNGRERKLNHTHQKEQTK